MQLILLGPPGSGKGTQAAGLASRLGFRHLATGDILREEVKNGTELGRAAKGFMERGELVPDQLILAMISTRLETEKNYIWDGFPRTEAQAVGLEAMLAVRRLSVDAAILLEVPDEVIVRRISGRLSCPSCRAGYHQDSMPPRKTGVCDRCGTALETRADDRAEVVENRLAVYRRQTEPLVAYYENKGKLMRVNGNQPPEKIGALLDGLVKKIGSAA
jgi:adenylate kinase